MVGETPDGPLGGVLYVYVVKEDCRALAAQFKGNILYALGRVVYHLAAGLNSSCHGDHVYHGMLGEIRADF